MAVQTRSQRAMKLAYACVSELKDTKAATIYGGLCHSFPVMVRTCGLCQALAFSADKAQSDNADRALAHQKLLQHVALLMGAKAEAAELARTCNAAEYMRYTRDILESWIYFKRFAASVLKVTTAQQED